MMMEGSLDVTSRKENLPPLVLEWVVDTECSLNRQHFPEGRPMVVETALPAEVLVMIPALRGIKAHFVGFPAEYNGMIRYIYSHMERTPDSRSPLTA